MTKPEEAEQTTDINDAIKAGDHVVYVTTDGAIIENQSGKVYGIFRTRDRKTLADVRWNGFGLPKRLSIDRLAKIRSGER